VMTIATKILNKIQRRAIQAILNKLGVSKAFPRWVAFGPKDLCMWNGTSWPECRTRSPRGTTFHWSPILKRFSRQSDSDCTAISANWIWVWFPSAWESEWVGSMPHGLLVDNDTRLHCKEQDYTQGGASLSGAN
jgi:hypothetical protein